MLSWVESCLLDAYRDQVPPIERKLFDAECARAFECIENQDNDDLLYGVLGCCELAVEEVLTYACPKFKVHAVHWGARAGFICLYDTQPSICSFVFLEIGEKYTCRGCSSGQSPLRRASCGSI